MTSSPPLRLFLGAGERAGEVVTLVGPSTVGRSASCTLAFGASAATVSGRHARLDGGASGWTVTDEGSRTGTWVGGERLAPREARRLSPGDWILLGASGVACLVLAPDEPPPRCWVVLEPGDRTGALLVLRDEAEATVTWTKDGVRLSAGAEAGGGRIRLSLEGDVARVRSPGDPGAGVPVSAGDLLEVPGLAPPLRVLGVRARRREGMGMTTLQGVVKGELARSRRTWIAVVVGLVVLLGAGAFLLLRGTERRHEDERQRLASERVKADLEIEALEERMARERDRAARELEALQERVTRSVEEQRAAFEAELARQRAATQAELAKLKASERERFSAILDRCRGAVFLLYVVVRFPDLRTRGGEVFETGAYGTGWLARKDGLVVTNKHVVQGWKWDPEIMAMLDRQSAVRTETEIYAWPSGVRFLGDDGRPPNRREGYNTTSLRNLRFEGAAPDEWRSVRTELGDETVSTRVHVHSDADLAVLRITGGPLEPLEIQEDGATARPLDPVMLLGFPLGARVLDSGRSDISASLGTVRFVSTVVAHTASSFPGNSGGPLVTLEGRVLGVLTRSPTLEHGAGTETFSLAIRCDAVRRLLERFP